VSVPGNFLVFIQNRPAPVAPLLPSSTRPGPVDRQSNPAAVLKRLVSFCLRTTSTIAARVETAAAAP
jgi:hypothetical protein